MTLFIARAAFDRRENNVAIIQFSSVHTAKFGKMPKHAVDCETVKMWWITLHTNDWREQRAFVTVHLLTSVSRIVLPSFEIQRHLRHFIPELSPNEGTFQPTQTKSRKTKIESPTQRKVNLFSKNRSVSQLFIVWYKHSVHWRFQSRSLRQNRKKNESQINTHMLHDTAALYVLRVVICEYVLVCP